MRFRELQEQFKIAVPRAGGIAKQGQSMDILKTQIAMNALGYDAGEEDGIFGPRTARAVRKFQKDNDLKVDGDPGVETIPVINQALTDNKLDKSLTVPKLKPVPKPQKTDAQDSLGDILSVPSGNDQSRTQAVLDFIAQYESNGDYDAVYPGKQNPEILQMTVDELFDDMRNRARKTGSSASGRYQYIRKTLQDLVQRMNLDPAETVFDKKTQDKIAIYHLKKDHDLDRWLDGKISSERFLRKLSRTWAGLPDPKTGSSYYAGVLDNRAGLGSDQAMSALDKIQGIA